MSKFSRIWKQFPENPLPHLYRGVSLKAPKETSQGSSHSHQVHQRTALGGSTITSCTEEVPDDIPKTSQEGPLGWLGRMEMRLQDAQVMGPFDIQPSQDFSWFTSPFIPGKARKWPRVVGSRHQPQGVFQMPIQHFEWPSRQDPFQTRRGRNLPEANSLSTGQYLKWSQHLGSSRHFAELLKDHTCHSVLTVSVRPCPVRELVMELCARLSFFHICQRLMAYWRECCQHNKWLNCWKLPQHILPNSGG